MTKLKIKHFYRLLTSSILVVGLAISAGCSFDALAEKMFGKSNHESDLPAENVYVDQKAINDKVVLMLTNAKTNIYVEQYEINRKDLLDLLVSKAKQGLEVRVLLDQYAISAKSTYEYLKSNGVSVKYYPFPSGSSDKFDMFVIDQKNAVVGGNCWTQSSTPNHDVAIELDGRAAVWLAAIFAKDYKYSTTTDITVADYKVLPQDNIILATNANIQAQIETQLQFVKTKLSIELPQFAYPDSLITLVADAAASGKQVKVILEDRQDAINSAAIKKLLQSGAEVRLYSSDDKKKLSAKFVLFDDLTTILGTPNWTYSSFKQNHELAVTIPSKAVTARLTTVFNEDWAKAKPAKVPTP